MRNYYFGLICIVLLGVGCKDHKNDYDTSGMFETQEVIVSSEISGRLNSLDVNEGDYIEAGKVVGCIDTMQLYWLKRQALQAIKAIDKRIPDVDLQLASYRRQLEKGKSELERVSRLYEGGAATQKQFDDVKTEVEVAERMLAAQTDQLNATIAGAREESNVYALKVEQVNDQIRRCKVVNPINGTVLAKYIEQNELAAPVKALYKIGDLENMYLRVYLENDRMNKVKIGDNVTVLVQKGEGEIKEYDGTISWISPEAEFVPKNVQTRDERQNLVYAVKIHVKNDGFLRVGMYADVRL